MSKVNKRILLGFQIAALPFGLVAILELCLRPFGYHVNLFSQVGGPILVSAAIVFVMLEGLMFATLALYNGKFRYFLPNLLIIPVFLLLLLIGLLGPQDQNRVHSFDSFGEEVVVTNREGFLGGRSYVYQREFPFIVREMAEVYGGDGWCPLCEESAYSWSVSDDELTLRYSYYGNGEQYMRFKYEDGHFIKVYDSLA